MKPDYIWIILAVVLGAALGKLIPVFSDCLITKKEKKKNKKYETWNMSRLKKTGYLVGTIAIWLGLAVLYPGWRMFYIGIVLTAAVVAAYVDSKCRILPNEIVFGIALAGIIYQLLTGGIAGMGKALAAMVIGGLVFFLASVLTRKAGAVGAGDVKYIMASAAMVGFPGILNCLLFMAVGLGGYCVIGILIKKLTIYSYFAMGVFISFGLIMTFFSQQIFSVVQRTVQSVL